MYYIVLLQFGLRRLEYTQSGNVVGPAYFARNLN
jgi:hypothetical protein